MLSVYQIWVDQQNSQEVESESFVDAEITKAPTHGRSVMNRAWPRHLRVYDSSFPRSNFFALTEWFLVFDAVASRVCALAFQRSAGEILRFTLEDTGEELQLFNPMLELSEAAVDWKMSRYHFGFFYNLTLSPSLVPSKPCLFRLPRMAGLFLSTNSGNDAGDFLYLYQSNNLTGLYFKKLWDEQNGGIPDRSTGPRIDD